MASSDEDKVEKMQEQPSSDNVVQKGEDWTQLLVDYHKTILSSWDLAIDLSK